MPNFFGDLRRDPHLENYPNTVLQGLAVSQKKRRTLCASAAEALGLQLREGCWVQGSLKSKGPSTNIVVS